jgi:hypothetical protein
MTATNLNQQDVASCTPDCVDWCCIGSRSYTTEPANDPAPARQTPTYKTGTRRIGERCYVGVLRIGQEVVAECGHKHTNREWTTKANGRSAKDCIDRIVYAARTPFYAAEIVTELRNAWQRLDRGPFEVTASQVEQFRASCAADGDALEALIAKVRTYINESA